MKQSGIYIRIQSSLEQFRLGHAVPAFVLDEDLHAGMCREFELLLLLRERRHSSRNVFDRVACLGSGYGRLCQVELMQHQCRCWSGIAR